MRVQENDRQCCGCTACANICPKNAIVITQDAKGFYYPEIDEELCIGCNLCKKVCDFTKFEPIKNKAITSYAVRHRNLDEVRTSRSGAFFSAVANYVIERGGVCYGAILSDDLRVEHREAKTIEMCVRFKGSKYVQSYIPQNLFTEAGEYLKSGRTVLFSGTGCQVHGLLSYLEMKRISMDSLITIDFICHGVPSPGVWSHYKDEIERRANSKLISVNFRDKNKFGWVAHQETYYFTNGNQESNSNWADVFYQHCMFRESCYNCPYTTPYRNSDFTIGDYWGYEKVIDGYRDNEGLSFVIAQNDKARLLLAELDTQLEIQQTELEKSMQPQLCNPVYKGIEYNRFWKEYTKKADSAIKVFFFPGIIRRIYLAGLKRIKPCVKRFLRVLHR